MNVPQAGLYGLYVKIATGGDGSRSLQIDGKTPFREASYLPVVNTGGWSTEHNDWHVLALGEDDPVTHEPYLSNIATATTSSPFAAWQSKRFGANAAIAGDLADPDGDGLPNLMEYALGSDPLVPSASPAPRQGRTLVNGVSYLNPTFTRPVAVTDATYIVEVSSDLIQPWQAGSTYSSAGLGSPSDANTVQVSRSTDANGIETILVRDKQAATSQANRMMRLRVQR